MWGNDHPTLFKSVLLATGVRWIAGEAPPMPMRCTAKIRYRQADQNCTVVATPAGFSVAFEEPQRAVTPGQSVVFYKGDQCLGGGIIEVGR